MGDNTYDSKDLYIYPFTIVTGENDQIIFEESGGTHLTATLDPGDYFMYSGENPAGTTYGSAFKVDFPSLPNQIADQMQSIGGDVYSMEMATPLSSSNFSFSGVSLNSTGGAAGFSLVVTSSAFTFPKSFLGFNDDFTTHNLYSDGSGELVSSYSSYGMWTSPSNHASSIGDSVNISAYNDGNFNVRQTIKWRTDKIRQMRYYWMHANHVQTKRNNSATFAGAGPEPLAQYDHGNYLHDAWQQMSSGKDFLIVYNTGADANDAWDVAENSFEVVHLLDNGSEKFSDVATLRNKKGEIYEVTINLGRLDKTIFDSRYPSTDSSNYNVED